MGTYGGYPNGGPPGTGHPARWWAALGVGIAVLAGLVVLVVLQLAGTLSFGGGGPRPFFGYWGGFFLLFLVVWVSFFVLRVVLWSSRGPGSYPGRRGRWRDPAVVIARQRYARGEITREQYDQIMTDLDRRGRGPGGPLSGG